MSSLSVITTAMLILALYCRESVSSSDYNLIQINPSHKVILHQSSLQIGGIPFSHDGQLSAHLLETCRHYDDEIACHYDEIIGRIKSTAVTLQKLTSADAAASDERQIIELHTLLINDLTTLAAFHKEQLEYAEGTVDDAYILGRHYDRARGSLLGCEYYHLATWELLSKNVEEGNDAARVDERHALALGAFGVSLHLSDLYDRYYAYPILQDGIMNAEESASRLREGYSNSYRYLLQCEHWCVESSQLLDLIDVDGKENEWSDGIYPEEKDMYVYTTQQSCAHSKVRIGTLLLTMYAAGYTLNTDEMLSYNPVAESALLQESGYDLGESEEYSEEMVQSIKRDQERLLHSVLEKIQAGIELYNDLQQNSEYAEFGDNRINLADSHNHLGVTHQYLNNYLSAIAEWKISLEIYRELLNEYKSLDAGSFDLGASSTDITQSLITVSQQCCDALLTLGHYEESKSMYRFNLKLRQQLFEGTTMDDELQDRDVDYDEASYYYQDDWNNPQYGDLPAFASDSIDESIKDYQAMLDGYHMTLRNSPEGSYHEVSFDADGSQMASIAASDKMYEGSLRSIIGSLHLAKNDARMARDELELAVELLKKGIQDEESGLWDSPPQDINGNEISLPLYLADALLNLSYAQAGMRQWHASMSSFEDSMSLYEKEIPEGQSPFEYMKEKGNKSRDPVQQRDGGLLERLKSMLSDQVVEYNKNINSTSADDSNDEL